MLAKIEPEVSGLSFVSDGNFWSPDRSGTYVEGNARGRVYADELLAKIRDEQDPTIFGSVIRAMSAGGTYGAVEIGFCGRIGIELIGLSR
jgi:hypothetical protein